MIDRVTPAILDAAKADEWIVVGGTRVLANALERSLAKHGREAIISPSIYRAQPASEMIDCVAAAIEESAATRDLEDIKSLLERTGAHTTGVVGPIATIDAIEHGAAGVVYMTERYRASNASVARLIDDAAAATAAHVAVVANGAAELLDAKAGGVGTILRFALHAIPNSLLVATAT